MRASTSYPYGLTQGGVYRSIRTNYSYDRLGRVEHINVDYGFSAPSQPLAHYEYYPTGNVKRVTLGNSVALDYTYHISGAVKTAVAKNLADNSKLFSEALYYEDCGSSSCTPQYNGNISRMVQSLAHGNTNYKEARDVMYAYDFMNRLTGVDDLEQDDFDEYFAYDAQGRITSQRRGANVNNKSGGEYVYYQSTNKLKSVANGMGGSADKRDMSASDNFEYDAEGNMTKDYSKDLTIAYDWRGMPVEFKRQNACYDIHEKIVCDSTKLEIKYDGSGRRISKTRLRRDLGASDWAVENVTHYTGIGTEVRETHVNGQDETKVVVNLPQGLGRYTPEDAEKTALSTATLDENGRPTSWSVFNPKFEWYLKNHIGSTMLVYGTSAYSDPLNSGYKGGVMAAYDYRATVVAMRTKQQVAKCCPPFGEQVDLTEPTDKVTENFTGKEKDDETQLNYFGARYLDPMLGLWTSVDAARQFSSPYLYAGNGMNPVNVIDPDGNETYVTVDENSQITNMSYTANENNSVTISFADETYMLANEPPMESYFYSKTNGVYDIVGQTFDIEMSYKVDQMTENANPLNIFGWRTGGEYDFKSSYGKGNNLTVGILNGTIMTARDAGNAAWAGYARWMYGPLTRTYSEVQMISDLYAGYQVYGKSLKALTVSEDPSSAVMQKWGFENYRPK